MLRWPGRRNLLGARGHFQLRRFERQRLGAAREQRTALHAANRIGGQFAFAMTDESFAQLSFGRHARRVVFFAAWSEKATGLLFTGRVGRQ